VDDPADEPFSIEDDDPPTRQSRPRRPRSARY
jgi:hypothetical protein